MFTANNTLNPPKTALSPDTLLYATGIHKRFTLHNQGGIKLPVLSDVSLEVKTEECVALTGVSGSGKSTLMKSLYGNYGIDAGEIWLKHNNHWVDLAQLQPHEVIEVRQKTIGYVSQFLRVIPRVPALDVAAEPLLELGCDTEVAYQKIKELFSRLNLPERLWQLSPTTFSGGEKQRVNLVRALAVDYPIFLLDEPTSALDAKNRQVVVELLTEKKQQGSALVGIFHDREVKETLSTRELVFQADQT
ncbi:phosphonate C-P lyase system protein PhnL [Pleurocapsales cyanobacterium LEGE 10410]|nr:phosphonate C-P lyase system protein PhnL [Pleurocapsales cyanobacterium LEGE 10410]